MRIVCTTQGTPEWHKARAGHITASRMATVLSHRAAKGRADYKLELVLDLEGVEDWNSADDPPWFAHGRAWEDRARGWYEYTYNVDVLQTGFVEHDEHRWLGASPDGYTAERLLEIKCHKSLTQWREAVGRVSKAYYDQVQTTMLVMGLPEAHLIHYWRNDETGPDLERGHAHRIPADPARQAYILERAAAFYVEVLDLYRKRNPDKAA